MSNQLTHPLLSALPGIRYGFFTRQGGVSTGIYESLNCGTGSKDDHAAVLENRARVTAALGIAPERLATPYQMHGIEAVHVTKVWGPGKGPKADAVVTDRPGIALGVGSADCGPTLFADAEAGIIGASHSGWRGALSGVLESTIAAMEGLGAARGRIRAVVGPCISQTAYEVGPEFEAALLDRDAGNARFFVRPSAGVRPHFDLPGYVESRLQRSGIGEVDRQTPCTFPGDSRFFSFRRSQKLSEPDYGRQISAIVVT